jgi:hypothetical protein
MNSSLDNDEDGQRRSGKNLGDREQKGDTTTPKKKKTRTGTRATGSTHVTRAEIHKSEVVIKKYERWGWRLEKRAEDRKKKRRKIRKKGRKGRRKRCAKKIRTEDSPKIH